MAGTSPTKQRSLFQAYIALGDSIGNEDEGIDVDLNEAGDANVLFRRQLALAPLATDTAINLANEMAACDSWGICDETVSATGFVSYAPVAGAGTKFQLPPRGTVISKQNAGTPPTLYLSNTSSTDTLYVRVAAIGSR